MNCTGSCSWKVYVKDGIITWESQQTDYPSVGPDQPGVRAPRLPARRGVLLVHLLARPGSATPTSAACCWRCTGRPRPSTSATRCWPGRDIVDDPERARRYKSARGKGGLVRATLGRGDRDRRRRPRAHDQEVRPGPGRRLLADPGDVDGLPRRPAPGSCSLIGGSMLSFYDWYADLPVASPQVFGDQTDVPESGDWWDAGYLIMWGSNVPVTRTPDAHWMTEARYRGQKVVAVSPDYADNVKFADEWLAAPARHRRRAGDGDGPRHAQGVLRRPADAVLHRLRQDATPTCRSWSRSSAGRRRATYRAGQVPHRRRPRPTHADEENAALQDRAPRRRAPASRSCPNGSLGHRFGEAGRRAGGTSTSATSTRC